jgi:NAD dependent epimerase/dehydratase family enzyme
LSSQRALPECLQQYGYAFRYENLEAALHAALAKA